jgi:hypothetical protein
MVGTDPRGLADLLRSRHPPESTHTVVVWTKNAAPLLRRGPLRKRLLEYDQVFVHLTITGMGGTALEPLVPFWQTACTWIPRVVELVGTPRRVRLRFDPIVHLVLPDGAYYTNLPLFESIAGAARAVGVTDVAVSWMSLYAKVKRRLAKTGFTPLGDDDALRERERGFLLDTAARLGVRVLGCCVPGWPRSACIDGRLLTELHPHGARCSAARDRGQRQLCGCTVSTDIGWYGSCAHGCLYCYAQPRRIPPQQLPPPPAPTDPASWLVDSNTLKRQIPGTQ